MNNEEQKLKALYLTEFLKRNKKLFKIKTIERECRLPASSVTNVIRGKIKVINILHVNRIIDYFTFKGIVINLIKL